MENASKALLIAGGILIAIILITLLIRSYGNIVGFQKQNLSQEEAAQLEEFNAQYMKYNHQYVYGTEVITVANKIDNYNNYVKKTELITMYIGSKKITKSSELGDLSTIKTSRYYCSSININQTTGRVDKIVFQKK